MPHQILIVLTLAFLTGVISDGVFYPLLAIIFVGIVISSVFKYSKLFYLGIGIIILFLSGAALQNLYLSNYLSHVPVSLFEKSLVVEGTVLKVEDQGLSKPQGIVLKTKNQEPNFTIQLETWDRTELLPGDRIVDRITINSLEEIDFWLAQNGIHVYGTIHQIESVSSPTHFNLYRHLYLLKNSIEQKITNYIGGVEADLINGILLGTRTKFTKDFKDQMSHSGTTHIVALSGFNISLVIIFLIAVLGWLPKRIKFIGAGVAILIFIIMTGLSSSVVRAAIMGWVVLLGQSWGRKLHYGVLLLLAAVVMTIQNPFVMAHDIGFQLSFVATAGLVFINPIVAKVVSMSPIHKLPIMAEALSATTSASLATLPLIAYYFGGISSVSLLANLAIVPVVPLVMIGGGVSLLFSLLGPYFLPLQVIGYYPAHWLYELIRYFGQIEFAYIPVPEFSPLFVAAWYSILVLVILKYETLSPFSAKSGTTSIVGNI